MTPDPIVEIVQKLEELNNTVKEIRDKLPPVYDLSGLEIEIKDVPKPEEPKI